MSAPVVPSPATEARPASPRRPDRHRDEYWDVFTASWRRATPVVPRPRLGD
jgi:hypothetical protein